MENVHTEELEVSIFKGWNLTKRLKRKEVQRQNIQDSGQIHQNSWSCLTTTQIYIYLRYGRGKAPSCAHRL